MAALASFRVPTPSQIAFALALALATTGGLAVAQTMSGTMERARRQAAEAEQRSAELEAAAARAVEDAARVRAAEAVIALRIQAAETRIESAEENAGRIAVLRAGQRAQLARQEAPVTRLLAALQTMARRPVALALVQPVSLTDMVHVRALLDAQVPAIAEQTAGLRGEIARRTALQRQADLAAARLRENQHQLEKERLALARLETRQRVNAQLLTDNALRQSDRAMAMAEKARSVGDLIGRLNDQTALRERLAALPGPTFRPPVPGATAVPAADAARPAAERLSYRMPVNGPLVHGLGEISDSGVRSRGITVGARKGAQVVAPARGRIAFAGPFRGYDNVVIVEHGGGWTSLLTGLATLRVAVGEAVDQGSPIGSARGDGHNVTVELRREGAPVDIAAMLATSRG